MGLLKGLGFLKAALVELCCCFCEGNAEELVADEVGKEEFVETAELCADNDGDMEIMGGGGGVISLSLQMGGGGLERSGTMAVGEEAVGGGTEVLIKQLEAPLIEVLAAAGAAADSK